MKPLPDPFVNNDPRWEPYQLARQEDLAQPDLTPTTLKQFLRSQEVQREIQKSFPPKPAPVDDGAPIAHIPFYR